ncbi:MAG TPA: tetratricopeptide repeat protein [Roseiarcus sp.]|nr:tetratricopeptide repeat protein [Roseiarcus sp.]
MARRLFYLLAVASAIAPAVALAQPTTTYVLPRAAGGPTLAPAPSGPAPDLAFGAFQRGYYITALDEAMKAIAANPRDSAAMTLIGELYRTGEGIKPDGAEAERWYRLAADLGDRAARFELGLMLLTGEGGVAKDRAAAAALFEQSAAQGHAGALYNLGVMAIEGDENAKPDFARAADLFKRAAELGDGDAAYSYGELLRSGRGVDLDTEEAARWIKRSADAGVVAGEVDYAIMLYNGEGVMRDETAAAKLFGRAAARNNPIAQNRLAHLYAIGRGVKQDLAEAAAWNMLAEKAGIKDAQLDSLTSDLTPKQRAEMLDIVRGQAEF